MHGYDINCIAFLKSKELQGSSEGLKFPSHVVSGADEKILRVFDAPYSFVKSANLYNNDTLRFSKEMTNEQVEQVIIGKKNEVASMTLGLMNKPIMPKKNMRNDEDDTGHTVEDFEPDVLTNQKNVADDFVEDTKSDILLTEEYLMTKSRWPERNKLYGHAYEIYCVATTKAGDYIVTAANAKKKKYSNIFVWTIDSLNPICQLPAHEFTVHQMEFSPNDQYLLAVSRDRQFSVFKRSEDEKVPFELVQIQKQAHKRVLWSCSWAHDSNYFATGSKEKLDSLKVWNFDSDQSKWIEHSNIKKGVKNATAVAFFPSLVLNSTSLALVIGEDSGEISIWSKPYSLSATEWTLALKFPVYYSHSQTVRRLKFKETSRSESDEYHLATCSNDSTVRIFKLSAPMLSNS